MKKEQTYESAYAELKKVVSDLEDETISVDTLSEKVKRAKVLIRFCREKLVRIEDEVEKELDAGSDATLGKQ
ncbi:MAG: exodeoxyribonuclease VII small subunit [Bacteroidetes bacterium]|nr:exodeoxyribonuclease VII small subunit [Bacteroidota bacterium]